MRVLVALAIGLTTLAASSFASPATVHAFGAQKDAGLEALTKQLKDARERERRTAVQELAKLATPKAWELVFDALKDTSPMVADEAQIQLGGLAVRELLREACDKRGIESGDARVRARVAESFGRMEGRVDLGTLSAVLDHKDADVRRMLAWSIERVARRPRSQSDSMGPGMATKELARVVERDKDAGVRAAALVALAPVDAERARIATLAALGDKAVEVRCAALTNVATWGAQDACATAAAHVEDSAFAVRAAAIDALASSASKDACALLVARLEKETSLRVRWRIVHALQELSGSDLELNPPYWRKWVEGLDDAWKPATGERKPPRAVKEEGTTVFMGLPVLTERVAILVDFSGSLWEKRADGKTRKESADEELAKLLKQLPPSAKFNVIPYTSKPFPWEKALVPATKENVARALDSFTKCKETGKGNVWDAIELAIVDPEVDTLLILTDGAPTGGPHWNLELMESLLHEKLRFRKIAIDAVLVDAGKFLQERWRAICEGTGGRMLAVEMR